MKSKPKILSVAVEHRNDEDSQNAMQFQLGRFSDTWAAIAGEDFAIIRQGEHYGKFFRDLADAEGTIEKPGRECRFFIPNSQNYLGESVENIRKYCLQDWTRAEALNNGVWCFIGIVAKAKIQLGNDSPIQTIHSGGLWGIESDAGDYLAEVGREQLAELAGELKLLGFGRRAIARAMKGVKLP